MTSPSSRPTVDARVALVAILVMTAAGCAPAADREAGRADSGTVAGDAVASAATADRLEPPPGGCIPVSATVATTGVGSVKLGGPAAALRTTCGGRDTSFSLGEGLAETGVVLPAGGVRVVALTTGGDTVRRILLTPEAAADPGALASSPATDAGLRVGSTIGAVRQAAPAACVLVGEGRIVIGLREPAGVSLATSASPGLVRGGRAPALAALPDTGRITAIWITGAGPACR